MLISNKIKKIGIDKAFWRWYTFYMIVDFSKDKNLKLQEYLLEKLGFENALIFKGELGENGLPVGLCEVVYTESKIHSIKFTVDEKNNFNGPAVIMYSDNRVVNFYFYNDDYAKVEYTNGAKYNGKVIQFRKHGQGTFIDSKGYKVEGDFIYDKKHGEYIMTFLDGATSKVTFLDDKLTGTIEKQMDKYTRLFAYFLNGKLIKAEYSEYNSNTRFVILKHKNDEYFYSITGKGQIFIDDELVYKGDIEDGLEHGFGEEFWPDGQHYVGEFTNGLRQGKGTMYDKNGNVLFEGYWDNDKFLNEKEVNKKEKFIEDKTKQENKKSLTLDVDVVSIKNSIKKIEDSIIGQRKAINSIANNLLLSFLCEREENKPITSILMTGPTGVGKTETAKQISEHIFNKKPFVVDFANFYGKHMLSSLIGAPDGYIGSDKTPELIKYIKDNQNDGGVILFEEIDKSDSECLNIFMRMLDEGEIISSKNVAYSVKNFVILATTNMSANHVNTLGFSAVENDVRDTMVKTTTGMKKEQLARFNLVTEFEDLTREDKIGLCKNAIEQTINRLKNIQGYNIKFEYDDKIIGKIVDKTNATFGVREIKKQASKEISQKLAEFIRNNDEKNLIVKLNMLDDAEIVVENPKEFINEK